MLTHFCKWSQLPVLRPRGSSRQGLESESPGLPPADLLPCGTRLQSPVLIIGFHTTAGYVLPVEERDCIDEELVLQHANSEFIEQGGKEIPPLSFLSLCFPLLPHLLHTVCDVSQFCLFLFPAFTWTLLSVFMETNPIAVSLIGSPPCLPGHSFLESWVVILFGYWCTVTNQIAHCKWVWVRQGSYSANDS